MSRHRKGISYRTDFLIHMRRDDLPLLERLRAETGLGYIKNCRTRMQGPNGRDCPSVQWGIGRLEECLRLIEIIETFPLRSKKARDFQVWAEAVRAKSAGQRWRLHRLARVLREGRRYNAGEIDWAEPESPQLNLEVTA